MPLIDSSAWIDYLRRSHSPVADGVARAISDDTAAITDVVVLEVMSGTTDPERLHRWRRLLARCLYLEQKPREDVESAAGLYRRCRQSGETPRSTNDCLVAAIAIRTSVPVLHRDKDFDVIARHCPLQIDPV